jgi:hypothetical protein
LPPAAATRTSTSVSYRVLAAYEQIQHCKLMCRYHVYIPGYSGRLVCACAKCCVCVFVLYVVVCGVSSVLLVAAVFAITMLATAAVHC